jgi:hypothetical protein
MRKDVSIDYIGLPHETSLAKARQAKSLHQGGKKCLLVRVMLPPSIFDWLLNPFLGFVSF